MSASKVAVTLTELDNGSDGDDVRWYAYNSNGVYLDNGLVTYQNANSLTVTIDEAEARYLVFTGTDSNDDFRVNGIVAQPLLPSAAPKDVFSYTITDSDGSSSNTMLTITTDTIPGANADTGTVFESGLTGTISGTHAGEAAYPTTVTGNLLANDTGISTTTTITSVAGVAATNGIITVSDPVGTLTVYTVDSSAHKAGDYSYALNSATSQGSTDTPTFNYTVTDSIGNTTAQSTLTISVVDDAPIGTNVVTTLQAAANLPTYNLVLVIDHSGSMGWDAGNGQTRMAVAKEALAAMLDKYDNAANINVQIIAFDSGTIESPWFVDDKQGAIDFINTLEPSSGTQYTTALNSVMNGFTQPGGAEKTLFYFISDGEPNNGYAVDSTIQTTWQKFVNMQGDISFGIGIGEASMGQLYPIAYPDTGAGTSSTENPYAISVDNATDLANTLLNTVTSGLVSGDVTVLTGTGSSGFVMGADGGHVLRVTIDGTVYNYSAVNPTIEVTTDKGGIINFNFVTGEFNYHLAVNQTIQGEQEIFPIVAVDSDGDTKQINLVINLEYIANLDANHDIVLTNVTDGSPLTIPTEALLHNDWATPSNSITASNPDGGTVSSNSGNILFDPTSALTPGSGFGPGYTTMVESTAGNDTRSSAIDLTDRVLFGPVTGTEATNLGNPSLASIKLTGTLNPGNNDFSDYVKVHLRAGETLYMDIDGGMDSGGNTTSIDTTLRIYNSSGTELADNNDTSSASVGGGGSIAVQDAYLSYTASAEGDYYVRVQPYGSSDAGNYELWLSIQSPSTPNAPVGFDYTLSEGSASDTTSVSVYGVSGTTITGTASDEILLGSSNADTLQGEGGRDALYGGDGGDTLVGGAGNDILVGGAGGDTLWGGTNGGTGSGNDTFLFHSADVGTSADNIEDFNVADFSASGSGGDKLDLSDVLQTGHPTDAEGLGGFLNFSVTNVTGNVAKVVLTIDPDGDNGTATKQTVNITMLNSGFTTSSNNVEIINKLLTNHELNT